MREKKFKAKRVDDGQWVFGKSLIQAEIKGRAFTQIEHSEFDEFRQYEVHPETVGQFIGIKDKNLVEIYEGDKFTDKCGETYVVSFEDFQLVAIDITTKVKHYFSQFAWNSEQNLEIIGNIHDK